MGALKGGYPIPRRTHTCTLTQDIQHARDASDRWLALKKQRP